jgi:hypothetical protein
MSGSDAGATPAWSPGYFSLLPDPLVAMVEAHEWIGEPLSIRLLYESFDRTWALRTITSQVERLSEAGVLVKHHTEPRRGVVEIFYVLAG